MGSIQNNLLYNAIYQVLLVLLPLVTAPYISRTVGAAAVGIYSYTNSVAYYFLLVAALGLANHGNRSIAAVRDNRDALNHTFSSIFRLQCITFTAALAAYILYLVFFVTDNRLVAALQMLYVFSGLLDISWLYFGLEKFKFTVTRNIMIKIATVLLMFIFVHEPADLWKYTLIMMLGNVMSQLYLWLYVRQCVSFVRVSFKEVISHIKPVLVLFVPVLAYSVYKVMDKIMLGIMTTYEQVGFYNSAEKIINIPMGIITALGTVMLPRMSNGIAKGDTGKVDRYIRISIKFVTIVASAIGFGLMGISDVFTPVFFGDGYEPCAGIIKLLAVTVFFIAWANVVRTQYLIPNHHDKIYMISTLVGAVLNLVINMCLIPVMQAAGAAIGTVVAELSVMLIQVVAIRKKMPVHRYIGGYVPILLVGAAMTMLVQYVGILLGTSLMTLVLQIAIGGLFFCVSLLLCLRFRNDELWERLYTAMKGKE